MGKQKKETEKTAEKGWQESPKDLRVIFLTLYRSKMMQFRNWTRMAKPQQKTFAEGGKERYIKKRRKKAMKNQ